MKRVILVMMLLLSINSIKAQNDPVLAGMILLYTEKAEKTLKNQELAMMMQTTGHLWTKEEVEATADLQREFKIYGFYHEITLLTENMGGLIQQLEKNTTNALAVALSTNRNKIYREVILNSVEIVNDIRTVCLSKNKMTEQQRLEIVFNIRPKLQVMNKKLKRLTIAVKYTSMNDVWLEINEGTRPMADKTQIIEDAKRRWKQIGRNVRP